MITFLDENDVEYGALATIKATNAVNGERSLTGTIVSGDYVLSNIERGWRLRFDDEYFVVTYAKPVDEGRDVQVEFDAVHQFFWDFDKSSVYDQLADGSHTFIAYLDFIFKNSGYSYTVDSALNVYAFEKQSFGFKKRLTLFNDIITSTGVEFQVNGKVVRILEKVGTDLSTVVRKNFNMNELTIEKNIGDFVTYQKGFGAYFDEEDHSKGRLEVEYTSPLANVYGKLEAEPFVDERYSQSSSLLAVLKENVDNSYTISVSLDMEDLTRAGYKYKQPIAGDYIMAINETLDFQEKIRIVSFTSEYDVTGQLIKHTVTCNDIGSVKKLSASYTHTQHQAANASATANNAYSVANKALVSADGKNTNYYGDSFPVDNPKGTLKTGDLLFLTVGDTVKQYYWNGADWVINPVLDDVEAFKEQIAEELKGVPNREEFENKIAEEVANSKAEIETQIETAKTQAESNAKEYADTINQETAKVAELANAAADEIKADLVNVKNNLTSTSLVANNAQAAVDAAKQELTEVANELSTAKQDLANSVDAVNTKVDSAKAELTQAKQDLMSHAQQLQTQADAQTELTKRVTTVETTANGTKTTVNELTKTVAQNGKDITSVTARTKVVEDDLSGTKTTLSQVKTTADSASQKTATLETGLNGLSARFDSLKIGAVNLLHNSKGPFQPKSSRLDNYTVYQNTWIDMEQGKEYTLSAKGTAPFSSVHTPDKEKNEICLWLVKNNGNVNINRIISSSTTGTDGTTFTWDEPTGRYYLRVNTYKADNSNYAEALQIEEGNLRSTYSQNESDIESKVAEYKQNADQNYASLQSNLQTLDGTVKQNKSEFDQTASQIKSSISAVEGKIPTSAGGRNLALGTSADWNSGWTSFNSQSNQIHVLYRIYNRGFKIGDKVNVRLVLKYSDIIAAEGQIAGVAPQCEGNVIHWGRGQLNGGTRFLFDGSDGEIKFEGTTVVDEYILQNDYWTWQLRVDYVASGRIQWKEAKAEAGDLPTPWSPAPEDTANQISNLSSEIKQTADGMTLLATKTELNTAKNELQSGINTATNKANAAQSTANSNAQTISTHTTQISALNTGLQAKVSQSDFNTLSGRVTTAENNITAKANELSSKITSVEGKIPTSIGGRNLYALSKNSPIWNNDISNLVQNVATGEISFKVTGRDPFFGTQANKNDAFGYRGVKIPVKAGQDMAVQLTNELFTKNFVSYFGDDDRAVKNFKVYQTNKFVIPASELEGVSYVAFRFGLVEETQAVGSVHSTKVKVEYGNVYTDWSPAPEDTVSQISSLSSQIQQTADGMTLLATKTELSTAKTELQSGIATATNKANSAQSTANNNAQTISTHTTQISALNTGLSAKVSQSDFNTLSGRVTTAENNIIAKANELSSKITSVEGKIPSGEMNLVEYGRPADGYSPYAGAEYTTHPYYYNSAYKMYIIKNTATNEKMLNMNRFKVERNTEYTLYFKGFNNSAITNMDVWFLKRVNGSTSNWDSAQILVDARKLSGGAAEDISVTFNTGEYDEGYLRFDNNGTATAGDQANLYFGDVSVKKGKSNNGWSPSLAELASSQDLKTAQSEFKQTTDAIKASVQSLDNSTVKSSSLTINADGIVMKAGKSTTDVANAIGSYFSVNQNAINLFSDKINVKGNMIVNGAITSDKISSKSINTAHLNGKIITADVIATNAITADAIKAGAVTTDKMSANSINGDRIAAGTLDAAKIKAGSITASQIASGTITSNQIKAGGISAANIAAGAITTDKIAAGAIDANKIAANAITANMIRGGQLRSTNGATVFDLNAGTLTFNNNYGYIQRVASDKVFEITTWLHSADANSPEYLTSAFKVRKSDNSRLVGAEFTLHNTLDNKPTASAVINADALGLYDSQGRTVLAIFSKGNFGNINMQGWGDIPVAQLNNCGLVVKDIGIGGHFKSLLSIVEELCKKAGIPWV